MKPNENLTRDIFPDHFISSLVPITKTRLNIPKQQSFKSTGRACVNEPPSNN